MKLFGIFVGLMLLVGCAFVSAGIEIPVELCDRKIWVDGAAQDFACLGDKFTQEDDDKVWHNVGEVLHPESPVLVIFWDNTGDCVVDIANLYWFYTAEETKGQSDVDLWVLKGAHTPQSMLEQIDTNGDTHLIKWFDCSK